MRSEIEVKRVMALKTAQIKVNPDDGSLTHIVGVECVLAPGDLERLAIMFKQRLPIEMLFISPQSRMDLKVEVLREDEPEHTGPVDPTTLEELRENAKVAIRTATNAESLAAKGDENDREVANASEDAAANAIAKVADATGVSPENITVALKGEIHQEIVDEGERQAESKAAEESQPPAGDPEALGRQIAEHANESEAEAEEEAAVSEQAPPVRPQGSKRQRKAAPKA